MPKNITNILTSIDEFLTSNNPKTTTKLKHLWNIYLSENINSEKSNTETIKNDIENITDKLLNNYPLYKNNEQINLILLELANSYPSKDLSDPNNLSFKILSNILGNPGTEKYSKVIPNIDDLKNILLDQLVSTSATESQTYSILKNLPYSEYTRKEVETVVKAVFIDQVKQNIQGTKNTIKSPEAFEVFSTLAKHYSNEHSYNDLFDLISLADNLVAKKPELKDNKFYKDFEKEEIFYKGFTRTTLKKSAQILPTSTKAELENGFKSALLAAISQNSNPFSQVQPPNKNPNIQPPVPNPSSSTVTSKSAPLPTSDRIDVLSKILSEVYIASPNHRPDEIYLGMDKSIFKNHIIMTFENSGVFIIEDLRDKENHALYICDGGINSQTYSGIFNASSRTDARHIVSSVNNPLVTPINHSKDLPGLLNHIRSALYPKLGISLKSLNNAIQNAHSSNSAIGKFMAKYKGILPNQQSKP